MKKRLLIPVALFFMTACMHEMQVEESVLKTFDCFTVSVEETEMTKAHIEDGGRLKWDDGDCIGIYSDTQAPVPFYCRADGKFYGEPITGSHFYAFYPYEPNSSDPLLVYDKDNPTRLRCGFMQPSIDEDPLRIPMVASSANNQLFFRQTCGLLHVKVKGQGHSLYMAQLSGENREAVCGTGFIDLSKDAPIVELNDGNGHYMETAGDENASIWSSAYVRFDESDAEAWDIYYPIPIMSFESGFTILFGVDGGKNNLYKTTGKTIRIERGKMKSFTTVSLNDEIELKQKMQAQEREALTAIYKALDGDHWYNNTNWCTDAPFDEWYGVWASRGYVTDLYLNENNVRGTLPPEIGNLPNLKLLSIVGAVGLTGSIPPEIANLHKLQDLIIHTTGLSGSIPPELGSMPQLERIAITLTNISGEIPPELGNCSSLKVLALTYNQLTGSIPESLGQLSNLKSLELNNNYLTGPIPSSLGNVTGLDAVVLINNYLSGPVPANFMMLDLWRTQWPWIVFQYNWPDGLDRDSFVLRGPKFSVTTCEGAQIDDSIYGQNEYTLLLELRSRQLDLVNQIGLNSLYKNYKKKGLEIIGYGSDMSNEELLAAKQIHNLPGQFFHYDRASEYSGYQDEAQGNVYFLSNIYGPAVNIVDKAGNIVFDTYYSGFCDGDTDTLSRFIFKHLGDPDPLDQGGDEPGENAYASTDYSKDGTVRVWQRASDGAGIDLVLLGDAFTDRLIADGTYDTIMDQAAEAFFLEEPYKTYRNCFNVYIVYAVSENDFYGGKTALDTWFGSGTEVGGNNGKVVAYMEKAINHERIEESLAIVLLNKHRHNGTCYMYSPSKGDWGSGLAIAYCSLGNYEEDFAGQIHHEANGHGFGKLADEYSVEAMNAPSSFVESSQAVWGYGFDKNIDFTSDPSKVKWSQFIEDERYQESEAGVFEGGGGFICGVWRSTAHSIMRSNFMGFNAVSRYAIWYRIHKLAYGEDWNGTYEDFVEYDKVNRTPAAIAKRQQQRRNYVEQDFEPLAPPVIINKDWRELFGGQRNVNR